MEEQKIDKQITGISGEFFVAAELAKRNFQVALTIGNAKSVDLFATNITSGKIFEIEVKTLRKSPNCFSLKTTRISPEKIFIFVYLNSVDKSPDYFILTGKELLSDMTKFYGKSLGRLDGRETINHGPLQMHKNLWEKLN